MMNRLRNRLSLRAEQGVTLPDVLVGLTLSMIITSLLVAGTIAVHHAQRFSSKDSENLSTLRIAMDRFEKEARQARKVYDDSTDVKARFWVDLDRDYQQEPAEQITWELIDTDGAGPLTAANLVRYTTADPTQRIVASRLVYASTFTYNNDEGQGVEAATLLSVVLTVNTPGSRAPERLSRTAIRLRNASPNVNLVTGGGEEDEEEHIDVDEEDAADGD